MTNDISVLCTVETSAVIIIGDFVVANCKITPVPFGGTDGVFVHNELASLFPTRLYCFRVIIIT